MLHSLGLEIFSSVLLFLMIKMISYRDSSQLDLLKKNLLELRKIFSGGSRSFHKKKDGTPFFFPRLYSIIEKASFASFESEEKLISLSNFSVKLENFNRRHTQLLAVFVLRACLIFCLSVLVSCFLKIFFPFFIKEKIFFVLQLTSFVLSFIFFGLFSFLMIKNRVTSFFYDKGLTPRAYCWIETYFLEKVQGNESYVARYKELQREMMSSGLSLESEKKLLLESWLLEQESFDQEKQDQQLDLFPVFELIFHTLLFVMILFPYLYLFRVNNF